MITSVNSPLSSAPRVQSDNVSKTPYGAGRAVKISDLDISKLADTDFDNEILRSYLTAIDGALTELASSEAVIGQQTSRVERNNAFVKELIDANNRGIGQLVDADLNEESAKLKALQVQEQLAKQALEIANSSTQNMLRLFQ